MSAFVIHVCTVDMSLRFLLLNQLRALQAEGFRVEAVSAPGPFVDDVVAAGVRHHAVSMSRRLTPLDDLRALDDLTRLFRRLRPDVVHTHNPKPSLLGQLAARAAGVPVVVNTIHGFYFHERMRPLPRQFFVCMEQMAAACSTAILSQNPEDVVTASREHISDRVELLGNGIDLTAFDPARTDAGRSAALRRALGLGPGPVVGFVGRLVAEKGVRELLGAFASIRAQHPGAQLLIVGPKDAEKADAVDVDAVAGVVCAGLRTDMPDLYALMDVFVLPSWREGFPRSPMEASAMGVPVVATDIRGCRQVVVDGVTGTLVPPQDQGRLADAIHELLSNEDRRRSYGRAGRQRALDAFDERTIFAKIAAVYRRELRSRA